MNSVGGCALRTFEVGNRNEQAKKRKSQIHQPTTQANERRTCFLPIQISRLARFPFQGQNAKGRGGVLYAGRSWHRDALFFIRPQCASRRAGQEKGQTERKTKAERRRTEEEEKRRKKEQKNRRTEERKRTQTETVTTTTTTTTTISTTGQLRLLAHPSRSTSHSTSELSTVNSTSHSTSHSTYLSTVDPT